MVTEDTTYAIDAEFAFYGPMAFDVCKMIANLLIAYFASFGLERQANDSRAEQQGWILKVNSLRLAKSAKRNKVIETRWGKLHM